MHLYGLERANGTLALVMELVDGPTLADRIAPSPDAPARPIPLAEALAIARQIADALEAAHGRERAPLAVIASPEHVAKDVLKW